MNKIHANNSQPIVNRSNIEPSAGAGVGEAAPLASEPAEKAASFERSKRPSFFGPKEGGDSRLVAPAGGGLGEISAQQAIDGHSTCEGDFTERRHVGGRTLFFTPEGARAVDTLMNNAEASNAPLRAEGDPSFWQQLLLGDPFAGLEQHTGNVKAKK